MSSFSLESPLYWVGGKRWQIDTIRPLWAPFRDAVRWVEPFCGGISMALGLAPSCALLNDANPYLINFYEWLQNGWTYDPHDWVEDTKSNYLRIRDTFNTAQSHDTLEDAKRFYWLNRMCYRGLYRTSSRGTFNTPYGYRASGTVPLPNSTAYQHQFESWTFTCGSYQHIERHDTDFLYVDPPYDTEFNHYVADEFTWDDQVAVAEWCVAHPGPVVLCNQATPRIVELYTRLGFTIIPLTRPERMRRYGAQGVAHEVMALRNLTHCPNTLF